MNGNFPKATDRRIFWSLVLVSVLVRMALPLVSGEGSYDGFLPDKAVVSTYIDALRRHPFEYLWYEHRLPVFYTLKNVLLYNLLPAEWVRPASYALAVALDAIATGIVYSMARAFGIAAIWSALAAMIVSLRFIMWEVLQWGEGWDSLNPFFVLLFAWALARFVRDMIPSRAWAAGAAGGILALNFQFGIPAVFAGLAAAILLKMPSPGLNRPALCAFALPVALSFAVVAKNGIEHGLWAPSSGAGQNIIQNLNLSLPDPEFRGAFKLAQRNNYPPWWFWCYEEAERRGAFPQKNIGGFYGMCMMNRDNSMDFTALRAYVAKYPDTPIRAAVEKDIAIHRDRPWLWTGPVRERSTGTSLEYGKVSRRLLFDMIVERPRNFASRTYTNLKEHFLEVGARFLISDFHAKQVYARFSELRLLRWFNMAGIPLFLIGFAAAMAFAAYAALVRLASWMRAPAYAGPSQDKAAAAAVSAAILAVAGVSAILTCCENYRHAFSISPVLILLATLGLRDAAVLAGRYLLKKQR